MSYRERYEQWLNDEFFDDATRRELKSLTDYNKPVDAEEKFGTRFRQSLS